MSLFPAAFKYVKIIPVFKKGSKLDLNNYRPISIIPAMSKVFESLLNRQIYDYFEENSLFSKTQFGFRSSHCTIDAVKSLITRCFDSLESGKFVSSRFFDLSKAFDTVSP